MRKIIAEHRGKQVAIVAHGGLLRIMIFTLLGIRSAGFSGWARATAASTSSTSTRTASRWLTSSISPIIRSQDLEGAKRLRPEGMPHYHELARRATLIRSSRRPRLEGERLP